MCAYIPVHTKIITNMAYLRHHPKSRFWVGVFRLPNGKYANRSTKTTDRKQALKLAESWEAAGIERQTESQARLVLSDIFRQTHGRTLETPTFTKYFNTWIEAKKTEIKPITLTHYQGALNSFGRFLGSRVDDPLHHIEVADVTAWRNQVLAKTSATTANNKLKVLRVLFQAAWRDNVILTNPAAKVKILRQAASGRKPFTLDQVRAVLKVATGEWRGMILFGLYTGQRLKDIATLTWAQVDIQDRTVRIVTSKTGRQQILPVAEPLFAYLSELPSCDDPSAPIFPTLHGLVMKTQTTSMLSAQFHEILATAGLVEARPKLHVATSGLGRGGKRVPTELSFHSLRHTATSLLKASGVPESVVRDIIGHESAVMSRLYTHVEDEAKRDAVSRLPDVNNPKVHGQSAA